jgi:hypothetical protein
MQPATFKRLYDRKKFGIVGVRTASLSQLQCKPGTRIATQLWAPRRQRDGRQGRSSGTLDAQA